MVSEEILVEGHIIDSLILSKILDEIMSLGGDFRLKQVNVGQKREDRSQAVIEVSAGSTDLLGTILAQIGKHGATFRTPEDVHLDPADQAGVYPEGFYSTTNQQTLVRHRGQWVQVQKQEMDCAIRYDEAGGTFECLPLIHVRAGDLIVVGHRGVKVVPLERPRELGVFEFMTTNVSTEKPKNFIIRDVAQKMRAVKEAGGKVLLVGGPAIVHTGAGRHVVRLIEEGYIRILFAGNALATHDLELALFGTSLGVYLEQSIPADTGHEHHLRAINTIRRYGSIKAAVEAGVITSGIMHACITRGVDFVLAGSIRDDGPLPEVITDTMAAQDRMRALVPQVGFALMVATTLHSVATGNILPAWVPVVCVDISPATITKLSDRGTFQTVGVVTDVEPFFRELLSELGVS